MENLSEKTSEILTLEEKNKILHDLFEWEEWELDASFLYKWKWAELYEKISLAMSWLSRITTESRIVLLYTFVPISFEIHPFYQNICKIKR